MMDDTHCFRLKKNYSVSHILFASVCRTHRCVVICGSIFMYPPVSMFILFPNIMAVTVLLISKISSTCFGQIFAHLQERKTEIFTAYGIMSC
jgi:hypothetical protein